MATRKTATTDKPAARTKAAATKTATAAKGAKKAPARKPAASGTRTTTAAAAKRKAAGTTTRKAPARKSAAASAAAGGKPSSRASKKTLTTAAQAKAAKLPAEGESFETARIAANAALDKKAENVVILDVRGLTSYADYFVVASGASDRQVSAIADNIEEQMKKAGHRTIGVEGYTRGHWVLLDFGDVVAHVFYEEARAFYDIEGLWADARRIPME